MTMQSPPLEFQLPDDRIAFAPPEQRGLARDGVALLVARPNSLTHTRFSDLSDYLEPGDLVVANTSPTMPAAISGRAEGRKVVVHLSTPLDDGSWIVELRNPDQSGSQGRHAENDQIQLAGGGALTLGTPANGEEWRSTVRLWQATLQLPRSVPRYLRRYGRPIRYSYVPDDWPLASYQTVFADRCLDRFGSAEMPSAGRPFTKRGIGQLIDRGIGVATIQLHTGVSSLEEHEDPQPERFSVSRYTARQVTATRQRGGRVIAIGTTVARALETVGRDDGTVSEGNGWTKVVLGPDRPAGVVDGLITGWHHPGASHLSLLEAVAGRQLVDRAYRAALAGDYLWHEFGDSCLFLPEQGGTD